MNSTNTYLEIFTCQRHVSNLRYCANGDICFQERISDLINRLQSIPLSVNASTSLGKSLASIILKPVEFPFSCLMLVSNPTGAPSIYALQADRICCEHLAKCSSTSPSKCCNKGKESQRFQFSVQESILEEIRVTYLITNCICLKERCTLGGFRSIYSIDLQVTR